MNPKGIDLSHNNGSFNWDDLRPDIQFVICKATQGGEFKDGKFNQYWQELKRRNIIRGAYHFLTFTSTAQEQAENFLSRGVNFNNPGCLPPILDIEDQVPASLNKPILADKAKWIQLTLDWLDIIEHKTGKTPIIYSYKNYFSEYLNDDIRFSKYPLWLASYQADEPGLPKYFSKYTFWQNSQIGSATSAFTVGDVDCNVFNGTFDELKQFANLI